MHNLRLIWILCFCSFSSFSYCQLSDFTFTVVSTDEVCTNTGMLEMNVANTNTSANAEITFKLFLAPDYVNSIAETFENSFSSLVAGNYRVVATQTLNGASNSKQVDVVIKDLIDALDYEISDSTTTDCDVTATLTVNVLSGNPTFYEIISGPTIRPLQTSNSFSNLQSGTYIVRVYDDCGDALSKAYTFVLANNDLTIGVPILPEVYTSCDVLEITNHISSNSGAPILYPLEVNYTVFNPNGSTAQNISQSIVSGPDDDLELLQNINLFGNQIFTIKIEVIDNCNNIFIEEFEIDPNPKVSFLQQIADCGELFFSIEVQNYMPPFTINFTQPAEFNPSLFNANYPGPFSEQSIIFGSITQTVPFGNYKVSVQDGCGRTGNLDFSLSEKPLKPSTTVYNNGCASLFGTLKIQIPGDRKIVSILLTEAPSTFPSALPSDMISFVNTEGVFNHSNLPVGDYKFLITDDCGDTYVLNVTVPVFVFGDLKASTRPDCNPTSGAVKLSTTNGALVMISITTAPATFMEMLPYNASININEGGIFYMSGLPAGNYTFVGKDICGFDLQVNVDIVGYTSYSNGFFLNRKCGSFDIIMNDEDESITGKTFWLQKYFPATNKWGHPYTNVAFNEGTIPNSTNAKDLNNPATLLNIFLLGEFRIIKVYESYNNGNPDAKCTDLYVAFSVQPQLSIAGVYNLSCNNSSGGNNVVLDVEGVQPFHFRITSPIILDNGENNLFENLPEGIYNFQVTDNCGNIKNISVEVGNLLPLSRAFKPQSMLVCRNDGVQFGIFPLVDQTSQVLGTQNPNNYNVTYHLTQADADNGENVLPDGYTNIANPQTIYVRVEHKILQLCYATTSFTIFAGIAPILAPADPVFICEGFTVKLTADVGYDLYEWSTGETTQSIIVTEPGTYSVAIKNVYEDFSCDASKEYEVTGSSRATFQTIDTSDWSSNSNSVVVVVNGSGDYVYSLDNIYFQSSNTFSDLQPGVYTIYVKDKNGCGTVDRQFVLLNYPKYFTPNDDGFNDTWHVQFSAYERNLNVDVFDRFGKFIIRLKGGEAGWDGTFNGHKLPSTDYWFVVTREDGTVYKGHFSLKR